MILGEAKGCLQVQCVERETLMRSTASSADYSDSINITVCGFQGKEGGSERLLP